MPLAHVGQKQGKPDACPSQKEKKGNEVLCGQGPEIGGGGPASVNVELGDGRALDLSGIVYLASESWLMLHWFSADASLALDHPPKPLYEFYTLIGRPSNADLSAMEKWLDGHRLSRFPSPQDLVQALISVLHDATDAERDGGSSGTAVAEASS